MSRSMASAAVPTHAHSLGSALDSIRGKAAKVGTDWMTDPIETNSSDTGQQTAFLALVNEAMIRSGLSQKAAAINARVDEPTFSKGLRGLPGKNFHVGWLDAQPIEFRIALAKLLSMKFGVSKETERAIVIRRLFDCIEELLVLTVVSE